MEIGIIKLNTPRLVIETLNEKHAVDFCNFAQTNANELINAAPLTLSSTKTIVDTLRFVKKLNQDRLNGKWIWNAIIEMQTNSFIGYISIVKFDNVSKEVEIGYAITKDKTGLGYASEALKYLLYYCFTQLDMNLVKLRIYIENKGSLRVAEKLGFTEQEILKEDMISAKGDLLDMKLFALQNTNQFQ